MSTLGYTQEDIRTVYIEPLRSALMIDDLFPRYEDLLALTSDAAEDESTSGRLGRYDLDSVSKILKECRTHNLTCDIENRVGGDTLTKLDHVGKSDLVILDYHLDSTKPEDPEKALTVLQHLADSPHANLVVVYTRSDKLDEVRRRVAIHFRGTRPGVYPTLEPAQQDFVDQWEPEKSGLSGELLDGHLRADTGGLMGENSKALRAELLTNGQIPVGRHKATLEAAIEDYLHRAFGGSNKSAAGSPIPADRIELSPHAADRKWVAFRNVFAVFISKTTDKEIFAELESALLDWQPLPMRVMLAHARNVLERGGFQYERHILSNADRLVGWFFHALTGEEPSLSKRIKQLWTRLLDSMGQQVAAEVAKVGGRILETSIATLGAREDVPAKEWHQNCLRLARILAGSEKGTDATRIFHALNTFLCSEEYHGSHLRTGTVCREISDDGTPVPNGRWLLCATPACDMVPRVQEDESTWKFDLDPAIAVTALRLQREEFASPLRHAEEGRHVFVCVSGEPLSFCAIRGDVGQPRTETLFVEERGKTGENGRFTAKLIRQLKQEGVPLSLEFAAVRFEAVAQLRASYADRLLLLAGYHNSRIGVDFVNSTPV
jgi:hypothetical protein